MATFWTTKFIFLLAANIAAVAFAIIAVLYIAAFFVSTFFRVWALHPWLAPSYIFIIIFLKSVFRKLFYQIHLPSWPTDDRSSDSEMPPDPRESDPAKEPGEPSSPSYVSCLSMDFDEKSTAVSRPSYAPVPESIELVEEEPVPGVEPVPGPVRVQTDFEPGSDEMWEATVGRIRAGLEQDRIRANFSLGSDLIRTDFRPGSDETWEAIVDRVRAGFEQDRIRTRSFPPAPRTTARRPTRSFPPHPRTTASRPTRSFPPPPPPFPRTRGRCTETAAECAVSACCLCFCCPLSVLLCCVKLPLKLAFRATRRLYHSTCCCGGGPGHHLVASSYSSFSDSDRSPPKRRSGCPRDDRSSRLRNS